MEYLISIIMPVYNVEKYLEEAFQSIEAQSRKNFELIIVNDGSTDDSKIIIDNFEENYSKQYPVTIINQKNKGLSEARNAGLRVCKGEYIYFFDSDDLITSNMIELVTKQLEKSVDLIKFNANQFLDDSMTTSIKEKPIVSKFFFNKKIINNNKLLFISRFSFQSPVWLYVYKTSLIKNNNLFFEPKLIFEDELFNAEIFMCVKNFVYINERLFSRRIRAGSITTKKINLKDNLKNKAIIIEKLHDMYISSDNVLKRKFILSRIKVIKKGIKNDLRLYTSI